MSTYLHELVTLFFSVTFLCLSLLLFSILIRHYFGVCFDYTIKWRWKMPQIFKALASILVWILWVCGLVMGFSVFFHGIIIGDLYGSVPPSMSSWAGFAVALGYGVGAVIVMKIRKGLE